MSFNLYGYVRGNPVSFFDPQGALTVLANKSASGQMMYMLIFDRTWTGLSRKYGIKIATIATRGFRWVNIALKIGSKAVKLSKWLSMGSAKTGEIEGCGFSAHRRLEAAMRDFLTDVSSPGVKWGFDGASTVLSFKDMKRLAHFIQIFLKNLEEFIENGGKIQDPYLKKLFEHYKLGDISKESLGKIVKEYNLEKLRAGAVQDLNKKSDAFGKLFSSWGDHETVIEKDEHGKRHFVTRFK